VDSATERNTKTPDIERTSVVCRDTGETLKYGKPWGLTTASRRLNGWTYFIGGDAGCIKIGWTGGVSADQRCKELQTGSPIRLRVLAFVRGGMDIERAYHARFKDARSHGEWFERVPEIEAEIARLQTKSI